MTDIDKAVVARIVKAGQKFEILVDCDKALAFRQGKGIVDDCLAVDSIYNDVRKGNRISGQILEKIFMTNDYRKVAEEIIKKGEVQVTQKHREQEFGALKKQIANIIHRNAVDSRTGLPHPQQRIENAIEQARVKIDQNKGAEEQVEAVLEKIRAIIPIKLEKLRLSLKFPAKYANAGFGALKRLGKLLRNEWQDDGSLVAMVEIPAGIQDEFFSEVNKVCHGEVESKIIKE